MTPGTLLQDRYEVLAHLGDGAVASVWRAHDRVLGIDVAVKVLHPHLARDPAVRERTARETVASRRVVGAVGIHELVEGPEAVFLVQELCPGGDLARRLDAGPIPEAEVAVWGVAIARTLQGAHDVGVLHRDIKPSNLLLDATGNVRLGDFGLARVAERAGTTATSMLAGSVGYAAPEIYDGVTDDPRSDQYALAATLLELATGERPWGALAPSVIMRRQQQEDAPPIDGLSAPLADVLRRALSRRPDRRFTTMAAFADALAGAASGQGSAEGQPAVVGACASCGASIVPGLGTCLRCGRATATIHRHQGGAYSVRVYSPLRRRGRRLRGGPGGRPVDWLSFPEKSKLVTLAAELTGDRPLPDEQLDRALRGSPVIAADGLSRADADTLSTRLIAEGLSAVVVGPGIELPGVLAWRQGLARWAPIVPLALLAVLLPVIALAKESFAPLAGGIPLLFAIVALGIATWRRAPTCILSPPGAAQLASAPAFATGVAERLRALTDPEVRERVGDVLRAASSLRRALIDAPDVARREAEQAITEAVDAALDLGLRLDTLAPAPRTRRGADPVEARRADAEEDRREQARVRIRSELLRIEADLDSAVTGVSSGQAKDAGERASGAAKRLRAVVGALG